jgi:ribosomal protein L7Ae-like RNA K-turn-binding protein
MNRNLQLLGIAKKAGLLAVGGDAVATAARKGKVWLVIMASDASESALRRASHVTKSSHAVCVVAPYTKFELGSVIGYGSPGTVAVLDAGLSSGFVRGLAEIEPDRYGEAAVLLEEQAITPVGKKNPTQRRTVR